MNAKAALSAAALMALLSACGSLGSTGPGAGELLRAPTSLSLAGRTLSAEALTTLSGEQLTANVLVRSSGSTLPLNVHSVYLVTQGGVWQAAGRWQTGSCGAGCRAALGKGPAQGLLPGENVQVVLRLQDSAGRNFWLRDDRSAVTRSGT